MHKYYIPEIEELHVGFEYEVLLNSGEWVPHTFNPEHTHHFIQEIYSINENTVRVKHLTKEDFISLGWTFITRYDKVDIYKFIIPEDKLFDNGEFVTMSFNDSTNKLSIDNAYNFFLFDGKIKNKSDFKRLMNQIGI